MKIKSTLSFIRNVHHIPNKQKVNWALLPIIGTPKYNLGVFLYGTNKVLNLKTGKFEQISDFQNVLIADRRSKGDWYEYVSGDIVYRFPKYYVSDMYYDRIYNKDMIDSYLL